MKKKLSIILMALVLTTNLIACNNNSTKTEEKPETKTEEKMAEDKKEDDKKMEMNAKTYTKTEKAANDTDMVRDITLEHDGENVNKIIMKITTVLEEGMDENAVKQMQESEPKLDGVTVLYERKEPNLIMNMTMDLNKISPEDFNMIMNESSLEDFKNLKSAQELLIEDGYAESM